MSALPNTRAKVRTITLHAAALTAGVLLIAGCGPSAYSDTVPVENMEQEAIMDEYQWQQEADIEQYKQELFQEELIYECLDVNAGQFYNEDEAIAYCQENLYDYYDPEPPTYDGW